MNTKEDCVTKFASEGKVLIYLKYAEMEARGIGNSEIITQ